MVKKGGCVGSMPDRQSNILKTKGFGHLGWICTQKTRKRGFKKKVWQSKLAREIIPAGPIVIILGFVNHSSVRLASGPQ